MSLFTTPNIPNNAVDAALRRFTVHKRTQSIRDLISYFAEDFELLIRRGSSWVFKALMEPPPATGKYRARLLRVVADSEDKVELLACEFIHRLRAVSGNVNAEFSHCSYGIRIEADGTRTRAEYLELIASDMPQQALRHLAASRVSSA